MLDSFAEFLRRLAANDGAWGLLKVAIVGGVVYVIVRAVIRFGGKVISVFLIASLVIWMLVSGFNLQTISDWTVNILGQFPG